MLPLDACIGFSIFSERRRLGHVSFVENVGIGLVPSRGAHFDDGEIHGLEFYRNVC
jgi:hypothetical protein